MGSGIAKLLVIPSVWGHFGTFDYSLLLGQVTQ